MEKLKLAFPKIVVVTISAICVSLIILVMMDQNSSDQPVKTRNIEVDVVRGYDSVEELYRDAEIVAEITVNEPRVKSYGGAIFTISDSTINKIYKGNIPQGQINILETGGISEGVNITLEGNAAAVRGDRLIVFARKYEGPVHDDAYVILGAYQGKFKLIGQNEVIPAHSVKPGLQHISKLSDLKLTP